MATQFSNAFAQYGGVEITIHKRIPVAAGLAGVYRCSGSLVGLDLLWKLGLTQSELQILAAGFRCALLFGGGTAIATGRGEQLSPLPSLDHLYVVLGKYRSGFHGLAYQTYRQQEVSSSLIGLV